MRVRIQGAGLAGQVLHRELYKRGVSSELVDRAIFPRDKVCGGCLQAESWDYIRNLFELNCPVKTIHSISHFWKGKKISMVPLQAPMVYVPRIELDYALFSRQQTLESSNETECLVVDASGAHAPKGTWLGFQASTSSVGELEMHYGKGMYAGISPTGMGESHAALLIRKQLFHGLDRLKTAVKKELGIQLTGTIKGTVPLDYRGARPQGLAVGDAQLLTHPFLGLGMTHAILSARLMAEVIASENIRKYGSLHRKMFRKYWWVNRGAGALYGSPLRPLLFLILKNPSFFGRVHQWLHEQKKSPAANRNGGFLLGTLRA